MILTSIVGNFNFVNLLAASLLAFLIAVIAYRFRAISASGAIGMIIVGTVVFGIGGIIFAVPLLFFFLSSSILSVVDNSAKKRTKDNLTKPGPRDIAQVFANGGPASICVLIYFFTGDLKWFFPYLASLCEATSDTWATEIGTLYRGLPRSIITWEKVRPGQSGGISVLGSFSALAGAIIAMLITLLVAEFSQPFANYRIDFWIIALNCGFAGCVLDSILGGSLQAQYLCNVCRSITEKKTHCGQETILYRGFKVIDNDVVNFISAGFAAASAALVIYLLN